MSNDDHNIVTKITADVLINHFRNIKPELGFERYFPGWTERISGLLATQYQFLHGVVDSPPGKYNDQKNDAGCILLKALNTVMSAIELARKGYVTEPLILLRHVLECVCTAFDVYQNPAKLKDLQAGKYDSTKSVGPAKQIVPIIGQWYGFLSDTMTHVGIMSTFPQWVAGQSQGSTRGFLIGGGFDTSRLWMFEISLHQIELGVDVIATMLEYIFFDDMPQHEYWKREDGRLVSALSEQVVQRAAQVIRRLEAQKVQIETQKSARQAT